jgi:hypothetical protein
MKNKQFILFYLLMCVFFACKKEELAPTNTLNQTTDSAAVVKLKGVFGNGPYGSVSGNVEIYQTKDSNLVVKLSNFSSSNGPSLYVLLAQDVNPVKGRYQDLGKLQSTSGNQVYKISGQPDFTTNKYISIHCVAYDHLFGYSLLK